MPPGLGYGSVAKAFGRVSRLGAALPTAGGAAMGGIYGAFSDDTSVIGGAIGGAMLGAGVWGGATAGIRGAKIYGRMSARGATRSQAAFSVLHDIGRQSKRLYGSFINKAVNPVMSTLKATQGAQVELAAMIPPAQKAFKQSQMYFARMQEQGIYAASIRSPKPSMFSRARRMMGFGS